MRLDLRALVREGVIGPGALNEKVLFWSTSTGEQTGNVTARYDPNRPDELVLHCWTLWSELKPFQLSREVITLERTPCHYGGARIWGHCPGCERRVAVLYSLHAGFLCVRCNGLAYDSTLEEPFFRLHRRGVRITERLGGQPLGVLRWTMPPPKPKRMHWRTYVALCNEWKQIRDQSH